VKLGDFATGAIVLALGVLWMYIAYIQGYEQGDHDGRRWTRIRAEREIHARQEEDDDRARRRVEAATHACDERLAAYVSSCETRVANLRATVAHDLGGRHR
jgi:hypothetical protein